MFSLIFLPGCGSTKLDESTALRVAAQDALTAGDNQLAIEKLTAALEAAPDASTHLQRAKLYAQMSEDDKARSDCESGLIMDADNSDLKWLLKQLDLPSEKRFQGKNAQPPSYSK